MKTSNELISEIESNIFDTGYSLITEYKTHNQFVKGLVLKNKSVRYILAKGGKSLYVGDYCFIESDTGFNKFDSSLGQKEVFIELENILRLTYTLSNPLKKEVMQLENNFRGIYA